jgi:hypothetical protein
VEETVKELQKKVDDRGIKVFLPASQDAGNRITL